MKGTAVMGLHVATAVILLAVLVNVVKSSSMEEALEKHLFANYTKHVRPSESVTGSVRVEFSITLTQLISVDEKAEAMTTSQYISLRWYDARLKWNPADFEGLQTMRVPSEIVWKPDLALTNNVEGKYDKTIPVNTVLNYTGEIKWLPPAIYTSSCSIQIEYFPFDWQNCTLRFQSFTYNTDELILYPTYSKAVVDEAAYTENGEWDIVHCPIKVNDHSSDIQYQDITLYFIIKRKPLFYITNIIFPCILISSSSFLVFCLPCASSDKTNLSISALLGLPVYLLVLSKSVPETSLAVPLIGVYLLFTMCTVTFSVIWSVMVLNIYHRSPLTHKLSPWMRQVFFDFLAPMLCMNTHVQIMRQCSVPLSKSQPDKTRTRECDRNNYDDTSNSKTTVRQGFRPVFDPVTNSQTSKNKPSKSSLRNQMAMCVRSISIDILESDSSSDSDTLLAGERANECINRSQQQRLPFRNPTTITRQEFVTFKGKGSTSTHDDTANTSNRCIKESLPTSSEKFVDSDILRPALPSQDCGQHEYFRLTFNNRVPTFWDVIRNSTSDDEDDYLETNRVVGDNKRVVNDEARSTEEEEMEESSEVTAKRAGDFRRGDRIRVVTFAESSNGAASGFTPSYDESSTTDRLGKEISSLSAWNQCFGAINQISGFIELEKSYKRKMLEWQMIAMVLDRLMFFVFLLIYIVGTAFFAIKAVTNYPPEHPFLAGEPKYVNCWKDHSHLETT